jgi:hypothetical protein
VEEKEQTFFTVSDSGFFLGTVALLNSLRLTGHTQELVVLDCGYTEKQKTILAPYCRLIPFDRSRAVSPTCFKPFPHLADPSGVVVIIDSDMIVTRSLREILDVAGSGRVCAFADSSPGRWFQEWQGLFDLPGPPRHQTYVNSGFVALSVTHWPDLLPDWWKACQRLWTKPFVRGSRSDPVQFPDQDSLNALLMSNVPKEALDVLPIERTPFGSLLTHVRVEDAALLRCSCRGVPTSLLHNSGEPKPWDPRLRSAWRKWRPAYVGLLRRVLAAPDVTVKVPASELPPWLRSGLRGAVLERSVSASATLRYRTHGLRSHLRRSSNGEPP